MGVDTTTSFEPTFLALLTRAYRLIFGESATSFGGGLTPDQTTQGLFAANLMLKGWQADGVNLFRRTQASYSIPPLGGTPMQPFALNPNVISVMEARCVVTPAPNLYERPMGEFSYVKYMQLPNKYNPILTGPSVWMYDRQQAGSFLYVYPPPANGCTINASVGRIAADIDSLQSNVDLPQEWLETFVYNLADTLLDDDATADAAGAAQTAERITKRAMVLKEKLLNFDRPPTVGMQSYGNAGPAYRGRGGRRRR
jgi:hypothetical protein